MSFALSARLTIYYLEVSQPILPSLVPLAHFTFVTAHIALLGTSGPFHVCHIVHLASMWSICVSHICLGIFFVYTQLFVYMQHTPVHSGGLTAGQVEDLCSRSNERTPL